MKNFEIACLHMWERSWLDKMQEVELMDIGQIDKSEGKDEDVNAVRQRRPFDRSNQKQKQESDNERKPFDCRTPSASRQSTPRDKKSGSDETKQSAGKKEKASHLLQVWWKGPSCQALPISR